MAMINKRSTGIPNIFALVITPYPGFKPVSHFPPSKAKITAFHIFIVAIVTIISGILNLATRNPFKNPTATPIPIAAATIRKIFISA